MRDILISALKESGKILLEYFDKPVKETRKESQSSIVTEADLASERSIIGKLKEYFPGHNIISEEYGFINNGSLFTWIIDPLDGTSNFAAGIPWFGTLIALLKGSAPVLGGAFLPVQDILYVAEAGKGSFKNDIRMPVLKTRELKDSLVAFCVDYTEDYAFLNKGMEMYKNVVKNSRNIRSTNCLIDFLYVAEGKFGCVLNLYTKVWDIAALGLIIAETGGVMKNIKGNNIEFSVNKTIINENFPVIAGSAENVRQLLSDSPF